MLGKLFAAQSTLERVIAELARSGANTSAADAQLTRLATLQTSIGTASAADLRGLGGEITAAVAQSQTVAQEARDQLAAASAAQLSQTLNAAAIASRTAVSDAMDSLHHIPVKFTSPDDEAQYRKREEERRSYIVAQQAKHTPQGYLNASGAGVGQMVDAKAHGASGPEFDARWKELVTTTERLREQVRKSGGSTKEFDDHLREDLRKTLKAKGLTEAQIDAQFAAHPDPLEAAKTFVSGNEEINGLTKRVEKSAETAIEDTASRPSNAGVGPIPTDTPVMALNQDAIAAKFRASGITTAAYQQGDSFAHGVVDSPQSRNAARIPV